MRFSGFTLANMFVIGFLTNSVIRRVVLSPMPPDTIYPCIILAACSLVVIVNIYDEIVRQ